MYTLRHTSTANKAALSFGTIVASIAYAVWANLHAAPTTVAVIPDPSYQATQSPSSTQATAPVETNPVAIATPTPAPVSVPTPTPTPAKPAGQYIDGSYTGTAADAYYGLVQVKAIIQGGQIADVQFIQYPNSHGNSRSINSYAMPILTQEAIQAQSAQVSGVSGATMTSQAFTQSLASALSQAKA